MPANVAAAGGAKVAIPKAPSTPAGDLPGARGDYGTGQANAYKATPAYHQAVAQVVAHQSPAQQYAIARGALTNPTPEGRLALGVLQRVNPIIAMKARSDLGKAGPSIPALALELWHNLQPIMHAGDAGISGGPLVTGNIGMMSPGSTGGKLAVNTLKDALTLPGETFSTAGVLGGDVLGGHIGKAASDLAGGFINPIEHPSTIIDHPLDTYLTYAGLLHGATRLAAGGVRAVAPRSAAGRAVATAAEPIKLTGKLTAERPRYSPYPLIKAGQKFLEQQRYERSPTGELVPRSESARLKMTAMGVSRLVGVLERLRRDSRDAAVERRLAAVRPSRVARIAHSLKNTLVYDPKQPLIPGADVLARIADGTIRRPDTVREDLAKHIGQVTANRGNLLENKTLLQEHDAYVKQLRDAMDNRAFTDNPAPAFHAAELYHQDYEPLEAEAHGLGEFGARNREALDKRTLYHYANTHMGGEFNDTLGTLVRPARSADELRAAMRPLRAEQARLEKIQAQRVPEGQLHTNLGPALTKVLDKIREIRTKRVVPMSLNEINAHLRGPDGIGERSLTFTSDRPKAGSAYYVPSDRRPLPQNAKNTLFAYTHGLTNPSHESLLEQHVRTQGRIDAHHAINRLLDTLAVTKSDGSYWTHYQEAKADGARLGLVPINLGQPFHAQGALDQAMSTVDPVKDEEEAQLRGLDLSGRLTEKSGPGRWGLIDPIVLKRLNEHRALVTPDVAWRTLKGINNQFRTVALSTSVKHVPGIIQEGLIRDLAAGEGLLTWITGRRVLNRAEQLNPGKARAARVELGGGTVAGHTLNARTFQVSDHFAGTSLHAPLVSWERFRRAPGPRQMRTAWHAWSNFALRATARFLEEQHQVADLGRSVLQDFGAKHGPFAKAMRLQGQMLDDAAKGLFDPAKVRRFRAEAEQIRGRWTDLTPHGQRALMLSPFGLWWLNSVKWLARLPIDHPVKTGALASATVGTQKERQALGLDMFSPGAVPDYMQGGVPVGGNIIGANYYSPMGVAGDPLATGSSLLAPTLAPLALGSFGLNFAGKPITSPGDPHGRQPATLAQRLEYIGNSYAGLFIPLYTKATQVVEGGASAYDSSNLISPQTKTPGGAPLKGLEKAVMPAKVYKNRAPTSGSSSSLGGGFGSGGFGSGGFGSGGF